jgi:hypothetical protein
LVRDADLAEKVMGRAIRRGLAVRGWVVNVDEGVLVHGG